MPAWGWSPYWLGLGLACFVSGVNAQAAPETSRSEHPQEARHLAEARSAVARAEALFEAANYDAALAEFERAYSLLGDDPRRAALLNNIAVCHERAFRYDLALHAYRRYLAEGSPGPRDRAQVEAVLRTLENLLGTLVVTTHGQRGELWVDDRHMGEAPATVAIPAGEHVVEVRAPLHEPAQRTVRVTARQRTRVSMPLRRLSDYRGLDPAYFYLSAVAAGALLATSVTLGGLTLAERRAGERLVEQSHGRPTDATLEAQRDIRRLALVTDMSLAGTALFTAGAAVLYLLTDWEDDDGPRPEARQATFAHVLPGVGPTGVGLSFTGGWP